jgi:hypothetical protein
MPEHFTIHPSAARRWANAFASRSRRAYPHLPTAWHLPTLLEWMQTMDPNGEWTCAPYDNPVTLSEALEVLTTWALESMRDDYASGDYR